MNIPDPRKFVESSKPLDQHKYQGWYWHYPTKKFYRWDDLPREDSQSWTYIFFSNRKYAHS